MVSTATAVGTNNGFCRASSLLSKFDAHSSDDDFKVPANMDDIDAMAEAYEVQRNEEEFQEMLNQVNSIPTDDKLTPSNEDALEMYGKEAVSNDEKYTDENEVGF